CYESRQGDRRLSIADCRKWVDAVALPKSAPQASPVDSVSWTVESLKERVTEYAKNLPEGHARTAYRHLYRHLSALSDDLSNNALRELDRWLIDTFERLLEDSEVSAADAHVKERLEKWLIGGASDVAQRALAASLKSDWYGEQYGLRSPSDILIGDQ
ncbi:MAG: hypothetical protein KC561_19540, partial [Myxococcales bacterium]|nr:hypothetical protein [Myxococcales bacterium]